MRFKIPSVTLAELVKKAALILEDDRLAASKYMKMTAKDGLLTLQVFNASAGIVIRGVAEIYEEGETGVPGKLLEGLAPLCTQSDVTFDLEGGRMIMRSGRTKFALSVIDPDTFRIPPDFNYIEMTPIEDLFSHISQVSHCTVLDDTRPTMGAVLIRSGSVASTDGKRLAIYSCPLQFRTPMVVSVKWLNIFKKVFNPGPIYVGQVDSSMCFRQEHVDAYITLIRNTYPNVDSVVPQSAYDEARVGRLELLASLRNAKVILKEDKNNILKIQFKSNEMHLSAESSFGQMNDIVPCSFYKDFEIWISLDMFTDAIKKLKEDEVVLTLRDKPLVIQEGSLLQLISPIVKN